MGETPNKGKYKSYFGPECIKDYVKDQLEKETRHSAKINYIKKPITPVILVINPALIK